MIMEPKIEGEKMMEGKEQAQEVEGFRDCSVKRQMTIGCQGVTHSLLFSQPRPT